MSTVFKDVIVPDPGGEDGFSGPLDVLVVGSRIAAVRATPEATVGATVVDGQGHHLLAPGLVNAHFHSPANHLKGSLPSMPLEVFMLYESPSDPQLAPTPREAYVRTMLAALEMLRTGTTSVQDDAFLMPAPENEIIDAVVQAYLDSGIRATVALDQPELPERDKLPYIDLAPDELLTLLDRPAPLSAPELLDRYRHLFATWHGAADGRIRAAVSVSAPQRVSPEYFAALDDLSRRYHVPLFAHMLETKVQRVLAQEQSRFAGRSLVRYTADLGLLNERTNVIHAVWVDDRDLDLVAAAGAVVVHNPVSNLRLGSGVMPFRAIRDRGIPVALGVDEAICNDAADLWNVLKMTGLIHNVDGSDSRCWPSPAEILDAAWQGGAAAMLQADELGRVAAGALADLVLIDLHTPAFTPLNDIASQLIYCDPARSVVLTMVDGQIVAEEGKVGSVDEAALLAEARELFAARRPARRRSQVAADRMAPWYRAVVARAAATDVGTTRWVGAR